jgi:hypothetical protein
MKSLGGALTVLFVALKLLGKISWSWIWVLSPIWVGAVLWFLIYIGYVLYIAKWGTPAEKLALYKQGILKP